MDTTTKQETGILIDYKEMPAYKGAKEKQELLVSKHPFVAITDNSSYKKAKDSRTALRQGRYDLQTGEKTIASKLKDFRELVKKETQKLIGITLGAENKQQAEIERYEAQKQRDKEEELKKERERKEALRAQVFGFRNTKTQAIETATLGTIEVIIADIKGSRLQVEEFADDFQLIKEKLIEEATRKQSQLQEDERLRLEREKAAEERKKLDEERKKLEAEKKKQKEDQKKQDSRRKLMFDLGLKWDGQSFTFEDINFHWTDLVTMSDDAFNKAYEGAKARKVQIEEAERKQKEEEEAKLKEKREAEEAKLKEERDNLEKEKAEIAKAEKERKEKEEEEKQAKHKAMLQNRTGKIKELGMDYNPITKELSYLDRVIWLNLSIDDVDEGTFDHQTLPLLKQKMEDEKKRVGMVKSDKEKLKEIAASFDTTILESTELTTPVAKELLKQFLTKINDMVTVFDTEISEL